jgi:hypothetical protein
MRMQTLVIFIFALCLVGYFMGMKSGMTDLLSNQGGTALSADSILHTIFPFLASSTGVMAILGIVAVGVFSMYAGFSAVFLIPAIILVAMMNYYIFPSSFFTDMSCVSMTALGECELSEFGIPFTVFLNLLTILAIIDFIRGSS